MVLAIVPGSIESNPSKLIVFASAI
jgi:hypothetical protein